MERKAVTKACKEQKFKLQISRACAGCWAVDVRETCLRPRVQFHSRARENGWAWRSIWVVCKVGPVDFWMYGGYRQKFSKWARYRQGARSGAHHPLFSIPTRCTSRSVQKKTSPPLPWRRQNPPPHHRASGSRTLILLAMSGFKFKLSAMSASRTSKSPPNLGLPITRLGMLAVYQTLRQRSALVDLAFLLSIKSKS